MTRRKILLITFPLILFLIGVIGYLFISSEYFLNTFISERLINAIQDEINEKFEVRIGDLHGNVLTGIEIKNLSIFERESDLPPILSTQNVIFEYHFFPLLRRNLLVKALEIQSPNVNIVRYSDGDMNLTEMLQKTVQDTEDDSSSSFAFAVARVNILNGAVQYSDSLQNLELNLPNIGFDLDGPLEKWEHTGSFSIGKGNFNINDSEIPIEQLENMKFAISSQKSDLSNRLKIKIGNSLIDVKDFERKWDNGKWETEIEFDIDTTDIQKFVNGKTEFSGFVSAVLNLKGTDSTINGSILCNSDKISISQLLSLHSGQTKQFSRQIDLFSLSIDSTIDIDDNPNVTLNELSATIANGTLSGNGRISFDNSIEGNLLDRILQYLKHPIAYESKWTITDLQLPKLLSSLVELSEDMPKITSGTISGLGDLYGNSDGNLNLDGEINLFDASVLVKDKGQMNSFSFEDSSLKCEMASEKGKESIITANGNIDATTVAISGSLDIIDVKLNDIDFGKISKIFESLPFNGIGNISAKIKKDGTANGYVELPKAYYGSSNSLLGGLTGSLRYKDNTLSIDNALLTKQSENGETKITIDGNVKLEDELPSHFTINANSLVLDNDYNKIFFQQEYPITGNLSGELILFGSLIDHLDGKGTFTVNSGNAWGINLDTATLHLVIDDYSLSIPDFELTTQGQQVFINAHATNDGEFDFSLKNEKDNPVQLANLALAADVSDFPLDGKMEVNVTSYQKKNEKVVFEVDLLFTDLTFEDNPLGDAVLHGVLIEHDDSSQEPDFFDFTGEAFEGTSIINGKIFTTQDSPYHFTMQSEGIRVSPILRIFDPILENISGTAVATTNVVGTITELVEPIDPSKKRKFPYDVDIDIKKALLQYNSVDFANTRPIHLKLVNDILTIVDSSLRLSDQETSFIELTGMFDTKNEIIDINAKSEDEFSLTHFSEAFGYSIDGMATYQLNANGPVSDPNIELKWQLPKLNVQAIAGDILLNNADGALTYQNGSVVIEPFSLDLFDNSVLVGGNVAINNNEINDSILNLDISSDSFDIAKLYDFFTKNISPDLVLKLGLDDESSISGTLGISAQLGGSISKPILRVNSHTENNNPILFGALSNPVSLDKLGADISINKQNINIQDVIINGKVRDGLFNLRGDVTLSTVNPDDVNFNIEMSLNQLDLHEFATLFQHNSTLQKAIISGTVKCSGRGIEPHLVLCDSNIDELNLSIQNYEIENTSSFNLRLNLNEIDSFIPLQITSSEINANVGIRIGGLLSTPNLSINWQGNINHPYQKEMSTPFQWEGSVDYNNNLIELSSKLTNNGDNLNLRGTIPFTLSVIDSEILTQLTEKPINVNLTGNELPLNLIPGFDRIFTKAMGVADVNLILQGSISDPHLQGNVSIEAPHIEIIDFPQRLKNVSILLNAQKDIVELTKCEFEIEDGKVSLKQNEKNKLTLDGIIPKKLEVNDLTLDKYPLTTFLRQAIPENTVEDIEVNISATLRTISIPLDHYFVESDEYPLPKLRELITFESITQNTEADFTIDSLSLGFTLLEEKYKFENLQPIPISLSSGAFIVSELKLENTPDTNMNNPDSLTFSSYGRWNMQSEILLVMKLDNFDLSLLNRVFPDYNLDTYKLNGYLSTDIIIKGTYSDPEITISFDSDVITLNNAYLDEFTGELTYSADDRQWSISKSNPIRLRAGNNLLTCSGTVPYSLSFSNLRAETLNEPMEILFALKLDEIGILSVIEPQIESANGEGTITATVSGTPFAPKLTGAGELNFVSLILKDSPIYFNDTRGQFVLSESELRIHSINGRLNDGSFYSTGKIDMDWFDVHYIDLETSLEVCNFAEPGQYLAKVSTGIEHLHLYGNLDKNQKSNLTLSGDVIIHSGNYEQNWENVRDLFSGSSVSSVELTFGNTLLDSLQLDLGIDIPEDFHFLSSIGGSTDIEITCNGRLTGLIQEPIFTGEVTILKGKISIITQEFDIVEGSRITNQSDIAFNPKLDILLKSPNPIRGVLLEDGTTADLMVTATVTGVLPNGDIDKARLNLQADPINSSSTVVFSDAYVMSLLLPGSSISRSFGGITFTISSGFDPNERHIIAEYPLPRNMSIKVEGDERGDFGVDVQLLERRF